MHRSVLLIFLTLFLTIGCSGGTNSDLQAENKALRQQVTELETQTNALQEELRELREQGKEHPEPLPPVNETPKSSVPKYVCAGLAEHMYLQLARGHQPIDLLDATVTIGFNGPGYPPVQPIPSKDVDFGPAIKWVSENPISLVDRVDLPLSQPGYQRVDMILSNGFYVSATCQEHRILSFLILNHAPGKS